LAHPADQLNKASSDMEKSLRALSKEHLKLMADLSSYNTLLTGNLMIWKGLLNDYKDGLGATIKKLSDANSSNFTKNYLAVKVLLRSYVSVTDKAITDMGALEMKCPLVLDGMNAFREALVDALQISDSGVSRTSLNKASIKLITWAGQWSQGKAKWDTSVKNELSRLKRDKESIVKLYAKLYEQYKNNHADNGLNILQSLKIVNLSKLKSEAMRAMKTADVSSILSKDNELLEKKIKASLNDLYISSNIPNNLIKEINGIASYRVVIRNQLSSLA
jgi:hypothetical protein